MANYTVKLTFLSSESGSVEYEFPHLQHLSDPESGMKATVIKGNRADGSLVIPGGKKSPQIQVRGKLFDNDGYADITSLMNAMRSDVDTAQGTLTLKHRPLTGGDWSTVWSYTVRRLDEIRFPQSMRTGVQEYECTFLILAF